MTASARIGKLHHVGVATSSLDQAIRLYRDVLGATDISERRTLEEHGVTVQFVRLGNAEIELLEPWGEASPLAGFLQRHPDGGQHHLCFEVEDVAAASQAMAAHGARVLGEPRIGAHGVPVVFIHPKDMGGQLVELMEIRKGV